MKREVTGIEIALSGIVTLAFGACAGAFVKDHIDAESARAAFANVALDRQHEREAATGREARLNEIIEKERSHHADAIRERDAHLGAFTSRSLRVRNDLEAMLSDSRRSAESCAARADGIAEAVGGLLDLVGEGAGLLKEVGAENQRLAAENRQLGDRLSKWQDLERTRHPERITITAPKKGPKS